MKIVFIQGANSRRRMFTPEDMAKLHALGEVITRDAEVNPTPEDARQLLVDADIVVTSWGCPQLTCAMTQDSPNLGLVVHAGGTVKPIFHSELFEKGIRIAANARVLGVGVAETTLGLTIASLKNLWQVSKDVANGGWDEHYGEIRELYNLKIGVVGAGYAGRHYMKLLRNFDVEVLLYDPYVDAREAAGLGAVQMGLEELLEQADVVSIHAPSIPETYHMFRAETFAMMKPNAILINTARGSLLDERALHEQMCQGKFQYACIDVTDPEPPAKDHPLRSVPNAILTPHLAGLTNNGLGRIGKNVVSQIESYLAGEPVDGEITKSQLAHMA